MRRILGTVLLAASLALLAGCGGSDKATTPKDPAPMPKDGPKPVTPGGGGGAPVAS